MNPSSRTRAALCFVLLVVCLTASVAPARAQALGSAGTVSGVVTDPDGAVVPNATVTITNPVTRYTRTASTGADGAFRFDNVPPNTYRLEVSAAGFNASRQELTVRTSVPIGLKIPLAVVWLIGVYAVAFGLLLASLAFRLRGLGATAGSVTVPATVPRKF